MAKREDITAEYVRERLSYDRTTGEFTWRSRYVKFKYHKIWNKRFSGSIAGTKLMPRGEISIGIDKTCYLAHRLAWLYVHGQWPDCEIDHIDGNPSNNCISNLRMASHEENCRNRGKNKNNKSGYKGVSWAAHANKWVAIISIDRKQKHLGLFNTAEEAARAYAKVAKEFHGKFVNIG